MELATKTLLGALTKVKPGLANSDIVEQSTHFVFTDGAVRTYNDHITVTYNVNFGIEGAVQAEKLYKLLSKIPDEEIDIEMDGDTVVIFYGLNEARINIDTDIKLPIIETPGPKSKKWNKLPKDFNDATSFCSFCASKNMTRPELTCLEIKGKEVVATDGYRATKWTMQSKIEDTFLLPASAAIELKDYNSVKYLAESNWLHFMNNEHTVFSCRTLDVVYSDKIHKFFKLKKDSAEISLPDGLEGMIDRVQILSTAEFEQDRFVTLNIKKNKLECRAKGAYGAIVEKVKIKYKGPDLELKVQPVFLIEILKYLKTMIVEKGKIAFQGEDFIHIVSLL